MNRRSCRNYGIRKYPTILSDSSSSPTHGGRENTRIEEGPARGSADKLQAISEHVKAQKMNQQIGFPTRNVPRCDGLRPWANKSALVAWLKRLDAINTHRVIDGDYREYRAAVENENIRGVQQVDDALD